MSERPEVLCRPALPSDDDALRALFRELELHYARQARPDAPPPDVEQVDRHTDSTLLSGGRGDCRVGLAEHAGSIVGAATYAVLHPGADLGGTLFLKDVYVVAAARGRGVGRALMRFLAREALENGCTRLDWTTDVGNTAARALYDSLGAILETRRAYYRLAGDALARVAAGPQDDA